jgi:hypothetical protein
VPDLHDSNRFDKTELYPDGYRYGVLYSPTEKFKEFMLAKGYIGYSMEQENTYGVYILDSSYVNIISTPILNT